MCYLQCPTNRSYQAHFSTRLNQLPLSTIKPQSHLTPLSRYTASLPFSITTHYPLSPSPKPSYQKPKHTNPAYTPWPPSHNYSSETPSTHSSANPARTWRRSDPSSLHRGLCAATCDRKACMVDGVSARRGSGMGCVASSCSLYSGLCRGYTSKR